MLVQIILEMGQKGYTKVCNSNLSIFPSKCVDNETLKAPWKVHISNQGVNLMSTLKSGARFASSHAVHTYG